MPANSRWDLIQRIRVKIVKNPGNGGLNNLNLNDPVLSVLIIFRNGWASNCRSFNLRSFFHFFTSFTYVQISFLVVRKMVENLQMCTNLC